MVGVVLSTWTLTELLGSVSLPEASTAVTRYAYTPSGRSGSVYTGPVGASGRRMPSRYTKYLTAPGAAVQVRTGSWRVGESAVRPVGDDSWMTVSDTDFV